MMREETQCGYCRSSTAFCKYNGLTYEHFLKWETLKVRSHGALHDRLNSRGCACPQKLIISSKICNQILPFVLVPEQDATKCFFMERFQEFYKETKVVLDWHQSGSGKIRKLGYVFDQEMCFCLCEVYCFQNLVELKLSTKQTLRQQ